MAEMEFRAIRRTYPDDAPEVCDPIHNLDSEEARARLAQLLEWYYLERDRQAENRLEMAIDGDFYDNRQWSQEDGDELRARGQMPLVYNEVAPAVDWLIGTELRTQIDWRVLPRAEDDVDLADVKTKVLKYVADVNRTAGARSRAFADAVKCGVGWVDDGARDDPTQDILYSRYEDWRNVLWDSTSYEPDLTDARYVFRWRWVDLDVARLMFPARREAIERAAMDQAQDWQAQEDEDLSWGADSADALYYGTTRVSSGRGMAMDQSMRRRRVKLIECQYRRPSRVKIVADGPHQGAFMGPDDGALARRVEGSDLIDKVTMRVHIAVFTEGALLSDGPSPYRHNHYTLTPIWCYRRGLDRMPYGVIRRVRDIQQDLNKRASKALHLLNTNQVIADRGAVEDPVRARDEVDRPDGWIEKAAGKELRIERGFDAANGQIKMLTLAAQSIQKTVGVNNENLGRSTNAVSGAAIEARQNQGSVGTTEPFHNLRQATQTQGQKQLSLSEQFYTRERVIRLTGNRGAIEWLPINQVVEQPDGSVRMINDMSASTADFVVSDADYAGTLRQVMFESLREMVFKLPPEIGMRLFTIAMDFSDLPNKDEIVEAIRGMTGERDPNQPMDEQAQAQAEQQAQAQADAMQMQREQAILALEEQRAKVAKIQAEARAILDQQGLGKEIEQAVHQVQQRAAQTIDRLSEQLRRAQDDLAKHAEADVITRIRQESDARLAQIEDRLNQIGKDSQ